jgi:carbon-monoxide dehydrogenase medium subunit
VRRELVAELVRGTYMTSLAPDEIIVGFEVPILAQQARVGVSKVVKKTGAFAMSLAIAVLGGDRSGGGCVALAGAGGRVLLLARLGELLSTQPDASAERLLEVLAEDLAGEVDIADHYATRLHRATVMRAVEEARAQ